MAIDRQLWRPSFFEYFGWPNWPCPTCRTGALLLNKKSLVLNESSFSKYANLDPWISIDLRDENFIASLICNNPVCQECVSVCGKTRFGTPPPNEADIELDAEFIPRFFVEAPPVFSIPDQCPNGVTRELGQAFALIWADVGSSGNRLRSAVEALLDDQKVPRRKLNKTKGKMRPLNLHERINEFRKKQAEAADLLEAVKWLGNAGSHASLMKLSWDDLLDGFELFEHVIDLIYVGRVEKMKRRAQEIIKQKGPAARTKGHRSKR